MYLLFDGMRPFPPSVQKRYLRPNEGHVRKLVKFVHNVVDDVLCLPFEVLLEGLQPSRVIVRMRYHNYL